MGKGKKDSVFAKQAAATKLANQLHKQFTKELHTEDRYVNYLKQFRADASAHFISWYAHKKVAWAMHGESLGKYRRERDSRWWTEAIKILKHIQQKKIFNSAHLWMNNALKLEGVELTGDLYYHHHMALHSTIVAPVAKHEVEAYVAFLESVDADYDFESALWEPVPPHTTFIKNGSKGLEDEYSPWYRYFDEVYDTGHLMYLPAPRSVKESAYNTRQWEETKKNLPPQTQQQYPWLEIYDWDFKESFVKKFETKEYYQLFKAYKRSRDKNQFKQRLDMACLDLENAEEAGERVAIPAHKDWRRALQYAAEIYKRRKTIEQLFFVLQEYEQRIKNNKSFDDWEENFDYSHRALQVKAIIEGRRLMGEPGNLDF